MKVIVDAMGGDNAPRSNVQGALNAVKKYGVDVVLVGDGQILLPPPSAARRIPP